MTTKHRRPPTTDHSHHWVIATPDGREHLPANCKHCGAAREYKAVADNDHWSWGNDSVRAIRLGPLL